MVRKIFGSRVGISERIVGEPVRIGGRVLRPVVRAEGLGDAGGNAAGGAYARLRLVPESVAVVESDGRGFRVPAQDRSRVALWGLAGAALLVVVATRSLEGPVRSAPGATITSHGGVVRWAKMRDRTSSP